MILYLSSKHLNKINDNIFLYVFYVNPLSVVPFSILEIHHKCLTLLNSVYKTAPRHSSTTAPWHQVFVDVCADRWVCREVVGKYECVPAQDQCVSYVPTCLSLHRESTNNRKASMFSIKRVLSSFKSTIQWSSVMGELCKYMLSGSFPEDQKDSSRDLLLDSSFLCVSAVLVPQIYHFVN